MPFIRYAHICEYARADPGGTVSVIGIFDTIFVQGLPARFPLLHVITSLSGQKGESVQFTTRLAGPDGQLMQSVQPVGIHFEQDDASANQINGYIGLTFTALGTYTVEILFNEMVVQSIPFKVLQRPSR
jgi:hypothetical protein